MEVVQHDGVERCQEHFLVTEILPLLFLEELVS